MPSTSPPAAGRDARSVAVSSHLVNLLLLDQEHKVVCVASDFADIASRLAELLPPTADQ